MAFPVLRRVNEGPSGLLFEVQNLRNILLVGSGLRLSVDSAVRKQKQTKNNNYITVYKFRHLADAFKHYKSVTYNQDQVSSPLFAFIHKIQHSHSKYYRNICIHNLQFNLLILWSMVYCKSRTAIIHTIAMCVLTFQLFNLLLQIVFIHMEETSEMVHGFFIGNLGAPFCGMSQSEPFSEAASSQTHTFVCYYTLNKIDSIN